MAATLEGRFYLAWLGFDGEKLHDSQCILRYSPDAGTWETVYQETSSRRGARNEEAAGLPSAFLTNYPSGKNGGSLRALRLAARARHDYAAPGMELNFAASASIPKTSTAALALREMVAGFASHYALFAEKGRNALKSRSLQDPFRTLGGTLAARSKVVAPYRRNPLISPFAMADWCSQSMTPDRASISGRWWQTAKSRRIGAPFSRGVANATR